MSDCCDPIGYRRMFRTKEAERAVRAFEKKGLDSTAGPMVASLVERGVDGASLLEVGAGSGSAQVVLLEAGAARSTAYDISSAYEDVAGALLEGRGLADRVEWHTGDFLADESAPVADVVFLNRVVCCYHDMVGLVDTVSEHSKRFVALSYPRDRFVVRFGSRFVNALLRIRKVPFRVFLHDPAGIAERVAAKGLTEVAAGRTALWHWKVWERQPA